MANKIRDNMEEVAGVILLAFMSVLAFLNVITRYFIHYSFASTEEVEVACLVWLTMLGASAGFRRRIHLGFDLLAFRFPKLGKNILYPLASVLTILTICILIWFSLLQMKDEWELKIGSEALGIPQWLYTLAIPVGGILMSIRIIEATWKRWKKEESSWKP
jgi:TRAP-type C4-dicarboxylate transport system permease small subunit